MKYKTGDIVMYNKFMGIYIDIDETKNRPFFICSRCSSSLSSDHPEFKILKKIINWESDNNIHLYGWRGFKPCKNLGINIKDLDKNLIKMLLSKDDDTRVYAEELIKNMIK